MICCDRCEEWYHFKCVGIKPDEIMDYDSKNYYCKYSKKCQEFYKKNASKKSQLKDTDEKKTKNDRKLQKQVEVDLKSSNRKSADQSSSEIQAQR